MQRHCTAAGGLRLSGCARSKTLLHPIGLNDLSISRRYIYITWLNRLLPREFIAIVNHTARGRRREVSKVREGMTHSHRSHELPQSKPTVFENRWKSRAEAIAKDGMNGGGHDASAYRMALWLDECQTASHG